MTVFNVRKVFVEDSIPSYLNPQRLKYNYVKGLRGKDKGQPVLAIKTAIIIFM